MNWPHPLPHLLALQNGGEAPQEHAVRCKISQIRCSLPPRIASGAKGRRFESYRPYQPSNRINYLEVDLQHSLTEEAPLCRAIVRDRDKQRLCLLFVGLSPIP